MDPQGVKQTEQPKALEIVRSNDIINLKNHSAELRGELELLLLADERLDDADILHVVGSHSHAVDAQPRILLLHLSLLQLRHLLHEAESAVLRERGGDLIQRVSEGSEGMLFDTGDLGGRLLHSHRAGDLRRSSAVDDAIVLYVTPPPLPPAPGYA